MQLLCKGKIEYLLSTKRRLVEKEHWLDIEEIRLMEKIILNFKTKAEL